MTTLIEPNTLNILVVVGALALLHGSFQLGVSVLSLLSGHALGRKTSHQRVMRLGAWYILGAFATISVIILAIAYKYSALNVSDDVLWPAATAFSVLVGILVLLFYYKKRSKLLWLPAPIAEYLLNRTKKTKSGVEAAALGIMTVVAELPFILAPMLLTVLVLCQHTQSFALLAYTLYALVACLPLLVVLALIGGGHKVSRIQKWRDHNKGFLQFVSGAGLIVLAVYAFVAGYMDGGLWR
jgi:cytochrome c biogenesis protein CcdA